MSGFLLHPRLAADTHRVGDSALCRVLLMNDARFPWLILVPRQADMTEIHHLSVAHRAVLMEEAAMLGSVMQRDLKAPKINLAALGNLVSQLHVHVIARFHNDAAWPGPVWGVDEPVPYAPAALSTRLKQAESWLASLN